MSRVVAAFGPACIGNVAAGFDVLGAAVAPLDGPWGDLVELREAASWSLVAEGPFAGALPREPAENLALKACQAFERRLGRRLPPCALRLHKGLPVASGLGSSSATVVATLRALDALFDHPLGAAGPLGDAELLAAAGEAEAHASGAVHLDNVAAALLGGLRLLAPDGRACLLPFPEELRFVLAVPALTLTTRAARAALPHGVSRRLAVEHAQNLAALVHALHTGNRELLRACLVDLLAEPHRAALVPGFRAVQAAALAGGALGCSLSGSGPSVFAVAEPGAAEAIGEDMRQAWSAAGIASEIKICGLDRVGARLVREERQPDETRPPGAGPAAPEAPAAPTARAARAARAAQDNREAKDPCS
ncbi:MAG TPA: homoserine kinase [Thermoanaerobaculia bacterium]|nr:homoserine kinase [Thermoanaerobaculia bacterium]